MLLSLHFMLNVSKVATFKTQNVATVASYKAQNIASPKSFQKVTGQHKFVCMSNVLI